MNRYYVSYQFYQSPTNLGFGAITYSANKFIFDQAREYCAKNNKFKAENVVIIFFKKLETDEGDISYFEKEAAENGN